MKNIGIWMDREKAHIIRLDNKEEKLETIFSEMEFFNRPADTNEKFRKELLEHHKGLAEKVKAVTKADSMTENQTKALVRDFFGQKK